MSLCLDLREIGPEHAPRTGGKTLGLAVLLRSGFAVPDGLCILTDAYRRFVEETALGERLRLELGRKDFRQMRWEELWDSSLRIRGLFSRASMPPDLEEELSERVQARLGAAPSAVRSSAIGEDSREMSFAGLHESVLNVRGVEEVLRQVRKVWASLWSDAALLYRRELGLEVENSRMAVLVQRFVPGSPSGVIFSQSPLDPEVAVLEAVAGLAKGLVDGDVEPERWEIDRRTGRVRSRRSPSEHRRVVAGPGGVRILDDGPAAAGGLLEEPRALEIYAAARRAETLFGGPQDVEWTCGPAGLQILQSRPVTARTQDADERRVWSLSLRRSFENLSGLREKIEGEILPGMEREAGELSARELEGLSDAGLAEEIVLRQTALERWTSVYWDDLIPFAHGIRLFGQVYNDALRPEDPFAFVRLLRPERLESVERNRLVLGMAGYIRERPELRRRLRERGLPDCGDEELLRRVDLYRQRYENLLGLRAERERLDEHLRTLLLNMSDPALPPNPEQRTPDLQDLELGYLSRFEEADRPRARELL
jgi:hypothetical protein